jgi:hypothetical protein
MGRPVSSGEENIVKSVTALTAAAAGTSAGSLARLASNPVSKTIGGALAKTLGGGSQTGWLRVTIACPPERLSADGGLPEPVKQLNGRAEVSIAPAPGDRGTELGLRPTGDYPEGPAGLAARLRGNDIRQELRSALRDAKSLIETGEVIVPDEPLTTRATATGKLLDLVLERAGGEGRL